MNKMKTIKVTKDIFDALEDKRDPDMPTHNDVIDALLTIVEVTLERIAEMNRQMKRLRNMLTKKETKL